MYSQLKWESGVHRVQRVRARHTPRFLNDTLPHTVHRACCRSRQLSLCTALHAWSIGPPPPSSPSLPRRRRFLVRRSFEMAGVPCHPFHAKTRVRVTWRCAHGVRQVPATESAGRVHTSTATVAIMPEVDDVDVVIDPKVPSTLGAQILLQAPQPPVSG